MAAPDREETNPYAAPEVDLETPVERSSSGRFEYAEFGTRFVAALIDGLICNVIAFIASFMAGVTIGLAYGQEGLSFAERIGQVFGILVPWLYAALQESSEARATLGKRIMGIQVVDLQGRRISFARASGRWLGKIVSTLILFVGFIMQQFTRKRQALHDIMAGTLVIRSR